VDLHEKVGLVLLGAAISACGYFLKRILEGRSQTDLLDRQRKLLEVNREMAQQGLSPEDMRKLEQILLGKAAIAKNIAAIEGQAKPLIAKQTGEFLSQAELNMRADANLKIAMARMEQVMTELSFKLEGVDLDALNKSQKAWEVYSRSQAEAESSVYQGGTIYPLIFLSELESLTVERAARLRARLDELRRR
jgi:uncharacterized protein YecT (DUF1311 family)